LTKEWKFGKQKAWLNEDNRIVYMAITGDLTVEEALRMSSIYYEIHKDIIGGGNETLLSMMVYEGKVNISNEARKALKDEMSKREEETRLKVKIAIVGATPGMRMMAKIYLKLSGQKDAGFFNTEEEAEKWLKE